MSVTASMGIVTPEAVVLEFRAAGLATRALAKIIDLFVQFILLTIVSLIAAFAGGGGSGAGGTIILSLGVFVLIVLLPALSETFWNGRTPGKSLMGLRVVTAEGGPITFRHALLRGLVQIVEIPTGAAVFVALANRRSQRLGDLAAGTFVISERAASATMTATIFYPPPGCEPYCSALDVTGIDSEQFLLVRNFLLRVVELHGDARYALAVRIASSLAPRCSPPPPAWMPAETYLICLASSYQLRQGTFEHHRSGR